VWTDDYLQKRLTKDVQGFELRWAQGAEVEIGHETDLHQESWLVSIGPLGASTWLSGRFTRVDNDAEQEYHYEQILHSIKESLTNGT
jgi:hypothetical protein